MAITTGCAQYMPMCCYIGKSCYLVLDCYFMQKITLTEKQNTQQTIE